MIDISEGMERNAVLGENRKESVSRVVENRGGKKPTRGGDEGSGRAVGAFGGDEAVVEDTRRARDVDGGIGVDVNVVEIGIAIEESFPEGSEMQVGIGEEEESDLELRVRASREMRKCGGVGRERRPSNAVKESEVVELVGLGNQEGLALGLKRREEVRSQEEEDWEGKEEREGEDERGGEH